MAADAISPVPVALGSATSDTEEGRAFFQERLGLYAMWIFHQLHIIQTNRVAAFRMLSEADVRAEHLMVAAALPPPVLSRALKAVERELARLIEALATGGEMAPVLDAVRSREDRRTTLQARLAELEDGRAFSPADAEQLERQVKERVGDWRALLRGAPQEARQVLRALIQERVTFTPTGTGRQFAHDLQQQPCKNQVSHWYTFGFAG